MSKKVRKIEKIGSRNVQNRPRQAEKGQEGPQVQKRSQKGKNPGQLWVPKSGQIWLNYGKFGYQKSVFFPTWSGRVNFHLFDYFLGKMAPKSTLHQDR